MPTCTGLDIKLFTDQTGQGQDRPHNGQVTDKTSRGLDRSQLIRHNTN